MQKTKSILEVKINERIYEFHCSESSPLGEVYDALHQMFGFVVERIKDAQPKRLEDDPKEAKKGD
jgi:hypothetical protein